MSISLSSSATAFNPPLDPADVIAFIDTIELFIRNYGPRDPRRLKPVHLRQLRRIQRFALRACRDRRDRRRKWGYRITVHQPCRALLVALDRLQRITKGTLARLDLAIDFSVAAASKQAVKDWLVRHAILKYRPPGPMHDEDNTTSWVHQSARTRRSNRDLIVYADRHSKITGEVDIVHLELKLLRTDAVGRVGYERVGQLFNLNPRHLMERCVGLVEVVDLAGWRRKAIRKMVKRNRERCLPTGDKFEEAWVAALPHEIASLLDDLVEDRAQRIKDMRFQPAKMRPLSWDDWHLPERLTYGQSTQRGFPKISSMISTPPSRRPHIVRLHPTDRSRSQRRSRSSRSSETDTHTHRPSRLKRSCDHQQRTAP